ncbi:MAG: hypothetical protein N3F64_02825 [Nitrososphaeria archaeon]|nr:hypothetical protein [Nitrososphaeria archaeon]
MQNSLIEDNVVLESSSEKLKNVLKKVMVKAKRSGIWWKLDTIERGILSLSTKLDIRFTSMKLLRSIVHIVKEIGKMLSLTYQNYLRGLKTAYNVAKFASENGYREAKDWVKDKNFIVWWGIFLNPKTYTK